MCKGRLSNVASDKGLRDCLVTKIQFYNPSVALCAPPPFTQGRLSKIFLLLAKRKNERNFLAFDKKTSLEIKTGKGQKSGLTKRTKT